MDMFSGLLAGHDLQSREIAEVLTHTGLADKTRGVYVQLCVESNFRSSPRWKDRAFRTQIGNVRLTLPRVLPRV